MVLNIRLMKKGICSLKSVDGYKTLRQKIKSIRHRKPRDKKIAEIDNFFWELLDTWGKNHDSKKNTRDHAVTES